MRLEIHSTSSPCSLSLPALPALPALPPFPALPALPALPLLRALPAFPPVRARDHVFVQVKLALALILCGGVQRVDEGGTKVQRACCRICWCFSAFACDAAAADAGDYGVDRDDSTEVAPSTGPWRNPHAPAG